MGQPDVVGMARRAEELYDALSTFKDEVKTAEKSALGSEDGITDPPSGDEIEVWGPVVDDLDGARFAVTSAQAKLATIEGYRHFRAAGVLA